MRNAVDASLRLSGWIFGSTLKRKRTETKTDMADGYSNGEFSSFHLSMLNSQASSIVDRVDFHHRRYSRHRQIAILLHDILVSFEALEKRTQRDHSIVMV